ncbi:unnamed protein product [Rotaria sordida]|uniref:DUF4371 domain-containing protein n=2 Tax=Rotaria sordida TaxID=392033 RepID=A0A814J4M3_9BILA|nr:unnamed protein product [Rotaria sordida]CAF1169348.1 unnamed protein product [Rotaria sordida]
MSEKDKLSYYFSRKLVSSSRDICNINHPTTTNTTIINTNELIVLNELDDRLSTSLSSSTSTCFELENQDNENLNLKENEFTTTRRTTTDNHELLAECSQMNSFKRDPDRGPQAAKEFLLLGPYQPITTFPTINHRHFCSRWYKIYPWIEFSEMTKKAYCFVYRLAYSSGRCDDAYTKNGFNIWSVAIQKFNKHQSTLSHKQANDSYINAVRNLTDNTDVLKLIDNEHKKQTLENRNYLKEIIRSIIFLAKQGLPFRGHREDDESKNKGNLLELLEFRSLENELIKKKLKTLKYTHHSIKNELLSLIQQHIISQIASEIKICKYYSVMIDETTDIIRHQQVSLVIRYTDDQFQCLFNLLIEWLNKLGLDIKNIVGQGFDGASSMTGEYKGVASRLIQVSPTALYVHCNWHVLNLCLVDVAEAVVHIRNNFGVLKSLYNLIEASPKRHKVFEDLQKEFGIVSISLKQLSDTRWACRYESLKVIFSRYLEILNTLEKLETSDSYILLQVIRTFDFIFHIYMMTEIYMITQILSKFLQRSNITLTDALAQVKITIDTLESLRNEDEFERIWHESMKICMNNNIDEPHERRKRKVPLKLGGGDINSSNLTIKDEYRVNSFYAVLDKIVTSIKDIFNKNYLSVVVLCEKLFLTKVLLSNDELKEIACFYNMNYDDLRAE